LADPERFREFSLFHLPAEVQLSNALGLCVVHVAIVAFGCYHVRVFPQVMLVLIGV